MARSKHPLKQKQRFAAMIVVPPGAAPTIIPIAIPSKEPPTPTSNVMKRLRKAPGRIRPRTFKEVFGVK